MVRGDVYGGASTGAARSAEADPLPDSSLSIAWEADDNNRALISVSVLIFWLKFF